MASSELLSQEHQTSIEFSRPFSVDKVNGTASYRFDISATKEECLKLSKRIGIEGIESLEAKFQIFRERHKGLFATGKVNAVVLPAEKSQDHNDVLEFDILLHLIEGSEEENEDSIDWENELVSDYDLEFYQNSTIDFGEIVSQYLSLELLLPLSSNDDSFAQLTMEGLDNIKDFSKKKTDQKKNPFEVLESLKK